MTKAVAELNQKIETLIAQTNAKAQCWSTDLLQVLETPVYGFISVDMLIPSMSENGDWYTSDHMMLLIESQKSDGVVQHHIGSGFLAKWMDEDDFFWYGHDVIEKVIAWMPVPKLNYGITAKKSIGNWG